MTLILHADKHRLDAGRFTAFIFDGERSWVVLLAHGRGGGEEGEASRHKDVLVPAKEQGGRMPLGGNLLLYAVPEGYGITGVANLDPENKLIARHYEACIYSPEPYGTPERLK